MSTLHLSALRQNIEPIRDTGKGFHVFEPSNRSRALTLRYSTLSPPVQKN